MFLYHCVRKLYSIAVLYRNNIQVASLASDGGSIVHFYAFLQ